VAISLQLTGRVFPAANRFLKKQARQIGTLFSSGLISVHPVHPAFICAKSRLVPFREQYSCPDNSHC
jgi:hypothetical protein